MRPTFSSEAQSFRKHVLAILERHLPADWVGSGALSGDAYDAFTTAWREVLVENGLLALSWPETFGGAGLGLEEQAIVHEEFARAGVPGGGLNDEFGISMLGNTLLTWGTEAQLDWYLPRILSGEDRWCQGYSEPDAGSDLANLSCRAVRDGESWVVDGQKIWTSAARSANWIFLLARSDPRSTGHEGVTFLLVPLDQPGVEVRPIRMMSGGNEFNEVFFSEARTDARNVVGGVGSGWPVAMSLLEHERGGRAIQQAARFAVELQRLQELAVERGAANDSSVRSRLAACWSDVQIMRYLAHRILTASIRGEASSPAGMVFKLFWSGYHQRATDLAVSVLGSEALVVDGRRPEVPFRTDDRGAPQCSGSWVTVFLNARAGTIYAGTSEVQKTILGERVLGLPKGAR